MSWLEILKQQVNDKGPRQVARELGISHSTLSLVSAGKYNASTKKVEARIEAIYGHDGMVQCPMLEEIEPAKCADYWNKAKKIGLLAGNPATLKLYKTCLNCSVRKG